MSDDYRAERVLGVPGATEFPSGHGQPQRRGYRAYADQRAQSRLSFDERAADLGLSASRLTPEVLEAIAPLLGELEALRAQVEQDRRRMAAADRAADRHSLVPCRNRRAFVRDLETALREGEPTGTLAVLHVAGVELLRRVHGLTAGEGALRHICGVVLGSVRETDPVGCLGGSDFAVLFVATGIDQATVKMEEIVGRLAGQPFTWLGLPMSLMPMYGVHALLRDEGAEQALAAADRALCRRTG